MLLMTIVRSAAAVGSFVGLLGCSSTAVEQSTEPLVSPTTSSTGSAIKSAAPSLPADFPADTIWFAPGVAVTLDGQHRVEIPEGEVARASRDFLIVTVQGTDDRTSTIRVRDIRTGDLLQNVERNERIGIVTIVGGDVYMSGDAGSAGPPWPDVGVLRLSIETGSVIEAIPPRSDTNALRGNLQRSPSGLAVASQYHRATDGLQPATETSDIELLSLESGEMAVAVSSIETNLVAMSDDTIFSRDESRIQAFGRTSGELMWEVEVRATRFGYVTTDGSRLVQPYVPLTRPYAEDWVVGVIDATSGEIQAEHPIPADLDYPVPELSNDRYVLIPTGQFKYRYLDLVTGEWSEGTVPSGNA
jgi:hypothetical protein